MRKLIVGSSMLAGLVACTTPSGETTEVLGENSAGVTVGTTYSLKLPQLTNSCLDVTGAGTGDGTNIEEWACGNAAANSFTVQNASVSGWYQLVNPNSGKCVDVNGISTAARAQIIQWTCKAVTQGTELNQTWRIWGR